MEGTNEAYELPPTPRRDRSSPHIRRFLRARVKCYEDSTVSGEGSPRITSFFQVRKRASPSTSEDRKDVDCLSKRLRRGINITDADIKSPAVPFPLSTPELSQDSESEAVVPSPIPPVELEPTPLGVFSDLPCHLLEEVINMFPVPRLVGLAISSREWAGKLYQYMKSKTGRNRFFRAAVEYSEDSKLVSLGPLSENNESLNRNFTMADPFYTFGELLKATTVCLPTSKRIGALIRFSQSVLPAVSDYAGWGRFIHTVSAKWAFTECAKVLRAVLKMNDSRLQKDLVKLMNNTPGSDHELEMKVRVSLRGLFIEPSLYHNPHCKRHVSRREQAFWLSVLLRTQPNVVQQGRLVMVLFGPVETIDGEERLSWRSLIDNVVSSWADSEARIKPISEALYCLLQSKRIGEPAFVWTENEIFNIVEEITTFPEPWSFDNFVMLLVHRTNMIPISICARIRHGYVEEAGSIFSTLKTLLFRWGIDVNQVLRVPMEFAMNSLVGLDRNHLFDSVLAAHSKTIKDHLEMGLAALPMIDVELNAQRAAMPILFSMARYVQVQAP